MKYVASKSMEQADSLSKRADWIEKVERDNENQVILKKKIEKSEAKDNNVQIENSKLYIFYFILFSFIS